jgi:MerR family transcriptional regulator/heat shock protein HspR
MGKVEQINGVYIMRVASMLTGMHPQTLRKYERAGLLAPSRNKKLRMYSEEDITRLKTIKHLVDDVGLNIAGVKVVLNIRDSINHFKEQIVMQQLGPKPKKQLLKSIEESLLILN